MVGGCAAIIGATMIGPRKSFVEGNLEIPSYGAVFGTVGTLILWFGWFGFNGGSSLGIIGYGEIAAQSILSTALSGGCGALGTLILGSTVDSILLGRFMLKLK